MGLSTNRYRREVNIEPTLLYYKHYIEKKVRYIYFDGYENHDDEICLRSLSYLN